LREYLHQSHPPIPTIVVIIKTRLNPIREGEEDRVAVTKGVAVGGAGVREGEGDGVIVAGLGVNVAVAGGVTSRTNF
jgi:hypothetical protein